MRRALGLIVLLALSLASRTPMFAAYFSDAQIQEAAEAALGPTGDTAGLSGIKVRCDTGILTLAGTADSLSVLRQAVRRVGAIPGVVDVIVTATVLRRGIPDAQVLTAVQDALGTLPFAPGRIQALVKDGRVSLSGTCGSYPARLQAEEAIAKVAGVADIVNRIEVTAETNLSEQGLSRLIRTRLTSGASSIPGNIEISVHGDAVTLTGRVPLFLNRIEAAEAVLGVPGVQEVNNRLLVDPALVTPTSAPLTP